MSKKSNKIVKSSGIIHNFNLQAIVTDIEIINLDSDDTRKVLVEVFNWSDNIPVGLPVISFNGPNFIVGDGGPIKIEPNTACGFFARLSDNQVFAYEVRITFFDTKEDVVATSQGLRFFENVVGQRVFHDNFRTVDLD
ncbi:hypothetical protein [Paenibacillus alvei]|uniref:Uncharacterized protein n=1 Tax=Paenibacillus alvei TaxID=44250 RepID=A0AAP7A0I0_PAEAL|nr:hypothetical protein [Paenibacillus alvei]MBG9733302.1 hypothetical protein [Paenibacillus alvei]MBG9745139.1 hypothetical protein [Paenibacillus alvei]MCY9580729.1 hypothetical protein [Paenibacillus alvei]MCY9585212.1 hypothetical protein [Paenibacillus alvei]NOJ72209.1 hypothetical protein [Paenibacillus alvei]